MGDAVCPGTFDPPTLGHLDVIARAAARFDRVRVAVLVNEEKTTLFTVDERIEMLVEATSGLDNVLVDAFSGLLVDYCTRHGAGIVVKGIRGGSDAEHEFPMARMNRHLAGVETLLMPASPGLSFVSSSLVKEVARLGGDIGGLVSEPVLARLLARIGPRGEGA